MNAQSNSTLQEQVLKDVLGLLGSLSKPDYRPMTGRLEGGGLYTQLRAALAQRFDARELGDEDYFSSYVYALDDPDSGLTQVVYLSFVAEYACLVSFQERYQELRVVTSHADCRSAQEEALFTLLADNGMQLLPQSLLDEPVPMKGLFRTVEPGEETFFTLLFEAGYPLWKLYARL